MTNAIFGKIKPKIKLMDCTEDIGEKIKRITSVCRNKNLAKTPETIFDMLYENGHTSIFEHIYFTFDIENITRACSHQLVRYRVGVVFTQQSQRSTEPNKFLLPPAIYDDIDSREKAEESIYNTYLTYKELIKNGTSKEDARYLLPNATNTKLTMTMNARELIVAGKQRLCMHAQEEIRLLFEEVQTLVRGVFRPLAIAMHPDCSTCTNKCKVCLK